MPADWLPITLDPKYQSPKGAYSPGVRAGDFLFVSGQIPSDPQSGEILGGDIETQTVVVLNKLRMVLEAGGAKLDDVVSVTVYLASVDDWAAFNEVYKKTFKPPYPARAVVGTTLRGILVEVSAIAKVS